MSPNFLIILTLGGLLILIPSAHASEPQMIQIFQPDVELLPDEKIVYGESFTIRAWLESYDDRPDDLGFYVDVMDPSNTQVDSTLWFAREDFVYEFDTTHPAYNITKSGPYQIKIEKAHFHERTGLFPKTITFEILFPEPEQDGPVFENCGPGTTDQAGVCVVDETEEKPVDPSNRWGGPYTFDIKPPLKQIKSGVKFHNVECKAGLELAYKKSDDTSACVTLDTKIELVVRGWANDDRLLLGCTPTRHEKCYPSDPLEYRKALYDYYFDDSNLSSSKSFDFSSLYTINACSDKSICFGKFDNGTKMRVSCDYSIHGCPPIVFDKYEVVEENEN